MVAGPVLADAKTQAPDRPLVWGDGRDRGPLVARAAQAGGRRGAAGGKPPGTKGFPGRPRRWVVDRPGARRGKQRRVAGPDYETAPRNGAAWLNACPGN